MKNSLMLLGALFLFSLYWFFYLYQPFWSVMAVATLLSIATHSLYIKVLKFLKSEVLSSVILTILLSILFFVPMLYSFSSLAKLNLSMDMTAIKDYINYIKSNGFTFGNEFSFLNDYIKTIALGIDIPNMSKNVFTFLATITKTSIGFFFEMIIILTFFFFGTLYSKELIDFVKKVAPVEENHTNLIFFEVTNVMSVVFYSILLTAMFEGALFALIGYYFGYNAILLGILYGFASLIPLVGGVIMWLPLSLYELSQGNITNAIIIALYSIIVISIIADTFIKPIIIKFINDKFLKTPTKINELIIFLSIIAGLSTFGFWGMILGPAITTFFISLLKVYKDIAIQDSKKIITMS